MQPALHIPFDELHAVLTRAMQALGLTPERAALAARLTAQADADGISTHGIARFPRFATMVQNGHISPTATPSLSASFGAIERWNGHRGVGNLAANTCMARAMQLAETHGLGAVALAETTHWQRGGTVGWQAAEAGYAAIAWTNTMPNLPPWGATTAALGNNPLVIAIPGENGHHIVLDMAMSQYSYGTLTAYRERGEPLPFPGGFDAHGALTTDAATIEQTQRALPIGLWKGSGLSFVLDALAMLLADGQGTHNLSADPLQEAGQSQVFLAFSPQTLQTTGPRLREAIAAFHAAQPVVSGHPPRFPGERVLAARARSMLAGVVVPASAWHFALNAGR